MDELDEWDEWDDDWEDQPYEPYLGPPPPHRYSTWYRQTGRTVQVTTTEPTESGWQEKVEVYFSWGTPVVTLSLPLTGMAPLANGDTFTITSTFSAS